MGDVCDVAHNTCLWRGCGDFVPHSREEHSVVQNIVTRSGESAKHAPLFLTPRRKYRHQQSFYIVEYRIPYGVVIQHAPPLVMGGPPSPGIGVLHCGQRGDATLHDEGIRLPNDFDTRRG